MKLIRSIPQKGVYFQTTETEQGNLPAEKEKAIINIYDDIEYQEILGFGGAFTESAAYNYALLSEGQKKEFMERYFSREKGIGYNFGRAHIHSCDFSLDIYTYIQEGDYELKTFSLARDRKYILPMIKDAMEYGTDELVLFASPWSPPAFMKENGSMLRGGKLKADCRKIWARYYAKYIKAMAEEGVAISAISVQNEPHASQSWESCSYTAAEEREFIEQALAPVLDEEGLSHIKIIIWDHNKERIYDRAKETFASKAVLDRVWAVGHHWYSGDHFEGMRLVHEQFGKSLISTEICGSINEDPAILAERYGKELCGDMSNFTAAFCDWNLLLSEQGGPFHNRSEKSTACAGIVLEDKSCGCHAPILYNNETKELIYTPIYYYIGHYSKYIQRGAKRIATTKYTEKMQAIAFKNPDRSIVLVVMNIADEELPATIRHQGVCTQVMMEPHSIMTVIL